MKSRAHFKGHPLHPMLIAFPLAFMVGCLAADLLGHLLDRHGLFTVGGYLSIAAVATGLLAGVPGFIDYVYIVPKRSSAKRRGTQHMIVNLTALALLAAGWLFRDWDTMVPTWPTLLLEVVSVALVSVGGWLGGTLVYRNQIGVDHRFANAGKWHEQVVHGAPGETVALDGAENLKPGQMWLLRWKDRRLVVARTDDGYTMFDDHCTHRGGSLADGALICDVVQCPWHGSQFNVHTGQVKAGPAEKPIGVYKAELRDRRVEVVLPSGS